MEAVLKDKGIENRLDGRSILFGQFVQLFELLKKVAVCDPNLPDLFSIVKCQMVKGNVKEFGNPDKKLC